MRSFTLAAIVILIGTFIANINATVPIPQDRNIELPVRSQLDSVELDLIESLARDVSKLPDEIAALHSRDNAFGSRQDEFDDRLCDIEQKFVSVSSSSGQLDSLGSKIESTNEVITRLLGRIEKLESSRGTYQSVGYAVGSGSTGGSTGTYKQPVVVSQPASSNHWTYPGGDIAAHLREAHGVVVSGSTEDQLSAHDAIHEGRSVTRSVSRTVQSSSNCPGGVCPTGQARPRLGLFRR